MNYFEILNLKTEPFSNSPDPAFFYRSEGHGECMHKLEIALRLRRGLSVVLGDVGTGKTTLCRQLIRALADDERVAANLVLDPSFCTTDEFLRVLHEMIVGAAPAPDATTWQMKEAVKKALFRLGVDEERIVVLIVDEGQKLGPESMELLRELLNYETNEAKLLQIVIFAQSEFEEMAAERPNFQDRINDIFRLGPLDLKDTREMVRFRLEKAKAGYTTPELFTPGAYRALHKATGGYPRKVIKLCHKVVLALLLQNRSRANASVVRACARELDGSPVGVRKPFLVLLALAGLAAVASALLFSPGMPGRPWLERTLTAVTAEAPRGAPEVAPEAPAAPKAAPGRRTPPPAPTLKSTDTAPTEQTEPAASPAAPAQTTGDAVQTPAPPKVQAPADVPGTVQSLAQAVRPPGVLGRVRMARGEFLSEMISRVYGAYRTRILRRLLEFNPAIRDYDRVEAGTNITFPALPAEPGTVPAGARWLVLGEYGDLAEAYAVLRADSAVRPKVRLLPLWTPEKGTRFVVVIGRPRATAAEAEAAVKALPAGLAGKVRVAGPMGPDAVYYTRVNLWKD